MTIKNVWRRIDYSRLRQGDMRRQQQLSTATERNWVAEESMLLREILFQEKLLALTDWCYESSPGENRLGKLMHQQMLTDPRMKALDDLLGATHTMAIPLVLSGEVHAGNLLEAHDTFTWWASLKRDGPGWNLYFSSIPVLVALMRDFGITLERESLKSELLRLGRAITLQKEQLSGLEAINLEMQKL